MLTVAAYSDRTLAARRARKIARARTGVAIVVTYDVHKEPWPFRVMIAEAGHTEWPAPVVYEPRRRRAPGQLQLRTEAQR